MTALIAGKAAVLPAVPGKRTVTKDQKDHKRHIVQYVISGLLTLLAATAAIGGFLLLQKRQGGTGAGGERPFEVTQTILTAASMDHSAWIRDEKVYIAGEPYKDQEAAENWNRLMQVAVSDDHLVALDRNGMAHAIGENGSNQCLVDGEEGIAYIAAGLNSTVCILADGSMSFYGNLNKNERAGLKLEKAATAVAMGTNHLVILREDGTVSAYGNSDTGACNTSDWKDVVSIAAGNDYTVGITRQGKLLFTGDDSYSQSVAQEWSGLTGAACGSGSIIGLKKDGTVTGTGRNTKGECNVDEWSSVASIAAGYDHTIGITKDGQMLATGYNGSGQCDIPSV